MPTTDEISKQLSDIANEARESGKQLSDYLNVLAHIIEDYSKAIKNFHNFEIAIYQILNDTNNVYEFDRDVFENYLEKLNANEGEFYRTHVFKMIPEGEIVKLWIEESK